MLKSNLDTRPLLYDVFSGAGGAAKGYMNAGFRVIGVDNKPQPRYCGDGFMQMDALDFLERLRQGEFEQPDAIHASPPCQAYSIMRNLPWVRDKPQWDSIPPTRGALQAAGKPWVLENVMGAHLDAGYLCGLMFGLNCYNHRAFETSFLWMQPGHPYHTLVFKSGRFLGSRRRIVSQYFGIDWMTKTELSNALPPAYTEFIGKQLIEQAQRARA